MKRAVLLSALLLTTFGYGAEAVAKPAPGPSKPAPLPAKPAQAKPAPAPQKPGGKPGAGKKDPPGTKQAKGQVNEAARRSIAGAATNEDAARRAESPELQQLREIEKELFAPAAPYPGNPIPSNVGYGPSLLPGRPAVNIAGLPTAASPSKSTEDVPTTGSHAWLASLKTPDITVRWDARVVRYLDWFKDDPRGRATLAFGWKRSGRYAAVIQKALKAEGAPEALIWLAMVESAFDPAIKSHAGAAGLWQFMPDGAKIYGLRVERWVDDRLDPVAASTAAAKYLSDLHRRFGNWELAMAAYNMGFGGVLSAVKKYNTNDYWELARYEAGIPWETTLYVPKIMAFAIAAQNPTVFGLDKLDKDGAVAFDTVKVAPGTTLERVATAAGTTTAALASLNPQLKGGRTPPQAPGASQGEVEVKVPEGKGETAAKQLAAMPSNDTKLASYVVKFGQTLDAIALEHGVTRQKMLELNCMGRDESLRSGDVVLVPASSEGFAKLGNERPVIVAPAQPTSVPGRHRVFYRVITGDNLRNIADAFKVSLDDIRSWNNVEPSARLQEGMVMQVFVPAEQDLSRIVVIREDEARVLTVGTDEFFAHFESLKGRTRLEITAAEHDTWETIARKYRLSVALLERINRRPRSETLRPGDPVVVYTTIAQPTQVAPATPSRPKASEELAAPTPKQPVDTDVQPEITRAPSEEPQLPPE